MTYSIFCFSDAGASLALKLCEMLRVDRLNVHSTPKYAGKHGFTEHETISSATGDLFRESDALIFIGAAGIAVRSIAPHVVSKVSDPAVLVIDDRGRFVISLLSGHIGGANGLARSIAGLIGAEPVITTATDGAGKFSCDAWAVTHDCAISSMAAAKDVSAAILTGDIPVAAEYPLPEELPSGLRRAEEGELGIYIGIHKNDPFDTTLRLIPRTVTLGIGCRKDISLESVMAAVRSVLDEANIELRAVGRIASIVNKKDEKGLLEAARVIGAETVFFTADELNAVPGEFEESEFVRKTVGTGNVCERAAVLAGGELIIKKTAVNGVTVAASVQERRIEF
ncbi:MAG: cobalt-precorrin 5A hydrolase [Eubacterium sp.]|nr:cobalt-precorrin 5A hydrolase [Eubacterium sp.]MBQ3412202.1 cobalt-precorrin 5A hydrolase [Oscillospiraceae bacterium]